MITISDFCTFLLACAIFALGQQLAHAEGDHPEPDLPVPRNPPNPPITNQPPPIRSQPPRSATPGPSRLPMGSSGLAAGPAVPHVLATPGSVHVAAGPSASAGPPSFPWSPRKGWSSTYCLGNDAYFRFEKRMQPRRSMNPGAEGPNPVLTPYWVMDKIGVFMPISPPNLSGDPNLRLGDVFISHTATQHRLWIWAQYDGRRFWKRVSEGYQRADGKCLLVTEVKKEPSWVTKEHYERVNKPIAQAMFHQA